MHVSHYTTTNHVKGMTAGVARQTGGC